MADITPIGGIDKGIDGVDTYVLITLDDADLAACDERHWEVEWPERAREALERRYYRESSGPGSAFCTRLTIIHRDGREYIGIAYQRYDC